MNTVVQIPPHAGPWPWGRDLPQRVAFDGSYWDYSPRPLQIEGWTNPKLVAGYREDVIGHGQSRHLYVVEDGFGNYDFEIRHQESNPKHHPVQHALEVVVEHPVLAVCLAAAATWAVVKWRAA